MRRYILRWTSFILFLIAGYQIIAPPVYIFSLRQKARSYIKSQAKLALEKIITITELYKKPADQINYQDVFNQLSIPSDEELEMEIDGYSLRISLLAREQVENQNTERKNLKSAIPEAGRDESIYRTVASYRDPGDTSSYFPGNFFYPFINWSWLNGQRDEWLAKRDIAMTWFIPVIEKEETQRLLVIESSAWNLNQNLGKMWRSYRTRLMLLLPTLFLVYILLEFRLIGKKNLGEVIHNIEKNTGKRWYPPWLMILGKYIGLIILFFLIYPFLSYYVIDMNNLDLGTGNHIALITIIGLPLFFYLIVCIISGIKHRRLFRYGIVRPSAYKKSETIKVQTRQGVKPRPIHKFIYEYKGQLYEIEITPSEIKKLAKQQEYHALFLPRKPEKAILIEMYLGPKGKL